MSSPSFVRALPRPRTVAAFLGADKDSDHRSRRSPFLYPEICYTEYIEDVRDVAQPAWMGLSVGGDGDVERDVDKWGADMSPAPGLFVT